jgi:tRNA dimethylallyltransferase
MPKYLISIVGPTGIGKTALSIQLAKHYNTEIISADSRQFFKELQIGTAAPNEEELAQVKHHFIHHKSIEDKYSVGAFEKEAITHLDKLFQSHNTIVMVGGSGLYVDAITKGLDHFPDVDATIRVSLNKKLKTEGLQTLQHQLRGLDIDSYKTIAIDNPHRIIRALEICIGSGQPYSSFLNKEKTTRNFKVITIGLTANREIIYKRINQRVDIMMNEGLLDEVKVLLSKQHLNALNTVGYKELFKFLNEEWTLDFAVSEIKKHTRRFAKRQITWFKRDQNTKWFDNKSNLDDIIKVIDNEIK